MNMMIGFGSHETQFEDAEEKAILEHIDEAFANSSSDYITDDFAKAIQKWVSARGKEYDAEVDGYKTAPTHPARYGSYWAEVLSSGSSIVAVLRFLHINRRHALSPDGWAALSSVRLVYWNASDRGLR